MLFARWFFFHFAVWDTIHDLVLQFLLCCFWFVFFIELLLIRCFYSIFFAVLFLLQCDRFATDSLFWFELNAFRTNYFLTIRLFLVFFRMYSYFLDHFTTLFPYFLQVLCLCYYCCCFCVLMFLFFFLVVWLSVQYLLGCVIACSVCVGFFLFFAHYSLDISIFTAVLLCRFDLIAAVLWSYLRAIRSTYVSAFPMIREHSFRVIPFVSVVDTR